MTKHFVHQIEKLKGLILKVGCEVEQAVEDAICAIENRDAELAQRVIDGDTKIDLMDVDILEECLHTLALYQPVASDLRFVASVISINKDLERIGDLAVNLAEQAIYFSGQAPIDSAPFDLREESLRVRSMLKKSLDAMVNSDASLAETVREEDVAVDQIHRQMFQQIEAAIRQNPNDTARLIHMVSISRQLERIADHAVNIAEDVYYTVRGEILRHKHDPVTLPERHRPR